MTAAAIYARVSSARQAKDQTIGSQLSALRDHAASSRLDVPEEWVFADEGHSGATLVRPGLEALRDLAAQGCLDVVLVYSPDRLARKFAYQALLIEELARCGARVEFVKGPRGDSPEDQLLIQFQGMFAEYEKAQLMERYRRGKAWRAKTGSVNVLGGAPFGYRYVRKTPESGAFYEVVPHEAALVTEMFRRYADDGAAIADLRRWLTDQGVRTRTGKERWDRSVIWGMLRNPAYAGTAVFGKTQVVHEPAGLNRTARLAGRTVPRQVRTQDRPREEWTGIPVPALVDEETFDRVQQRLADNKRFASRNTKVPSLLQGIAACASCGYGYYRTTTTTTAGNKIYYYRCLGSDDYRYQGGRVCGNKPVRADYADKVVWDHLTALLADPALIRAEIDKRLERARTSNPVTRKRGQLEQALAKTAASIASMITAFSEQLLTIDELRARMPDLRARETGLKDQIAALDAQATDRDAYLKLAGDLEGFLARLRASSATATTEDRQRVLRALAQDVLIGPEKITIRHRIPVREHTSGADVIRPSLGWLLAPATPAGLSAEMARVRDPAGFAALAVICQADRVNSHTTQLALRRIAAVLAAKGGLIADITIGDCLELLKIAGDLLRSSDATSPYFYQLLRAAGVLGAAAPPGRALKTQGQLSCEQLIDRYGIECRPVRDLLVDYLRERQPAVDYPTLHKLSYVLGRLFWRDLELHHPGIASLHLPAEPAAAWKQRITTKTTRSRSADGDVTEANASRVNALDHLVTVRAFYLDLAQWAAEDPARWGPWAAPCPIRDTDIAQRGKERSRRKSRMDQRTRERIPVLPALLAKVDAGRQAAAERLRAAEAAAPGQLFTVAGQTLRRPARAHASAGRTWAQDPSRGKHRDLTLEEHKAFWTWAAVQVLRHTGIRIEELTELSHHSFIQYKLPATGELIPLLQIAPSKTDTERLLVSPELADVLSEIICRIRGQDGTVPLVTAYDYHERVWNPPMPLLFQRRYGGEHHAIGGPAIRELISDALASTGITDASGKPLRFVPHDFRRILSA